MHHDVFYSVKFKAYSGLNLSFSFPLIILQGADEDILPLKDTW